MVAQGATSGIAPQGAELLGEGVGPHAQLCSSHQRRRGREGVLQLNAAGGGSYSSPCGGGVAQQQASTGRGSQGVGVAALDGHDLLPACSSEGRSSSSCFCSVDHGSTEAGRGASSQPGAVLEHAGSNHLLLTRCTCSCCCTSAHLSITAPVHASYGPGAAGGSCAAGACLPTEGLPHAAKL